MDTLLLLVGLALILGGANYLTDGAAAIAKRFNISEFIVGLTIVAIGTSMPEMVVSVISALEGHGEIAVGNVVGSNMFNTYVILGICALIRPMDITKNNVKRDIPMGILASAVLLLVTHSGVIPQAYGALMVLIYFALMLYSIRASRKDAHLDEPLESHEGAMKPWVAILLVVGGLGGLVYGGELFLGSAVAIAEKFGIPQNIIAITLVAGGTSFPELAASLVSLMKGKNDIALGNILGSNIANIFLVIGMSATITPITLGAITIIDLLVVALGSVLLLVAAFTFKKNMLDRVEAAIFLLIFGGYMFWLIG